MSESANKLFRSEKVIDSLISAGIITDKLCDRIKARDIIKEYLVETHNEAVLKTVMAHNRPRFVAPDYTDL